jgi:hypothetical protein
MTSPIVIETTSPPEPVVPDPFIADVAVPIAAPAPPEPRRRRIWD